MAMHNPPHPGEFIYNVYMEPFNYSSRFIASKLDVSASTFSRIISGKSVITPEMALKLSKALGRSPQSWLTMQDNHSLWLAKKHVDLDKVSSIDFVLA